MIECNSFQIKYHSFYKIWQIFDETVKNCVAEFKHLQDALDYCKTA